jgi:hypothetical protein
MRGYILGKVERAANTTGSAWQVILALYVFQKEVDRWRYQKVTSTVRQHMIQDV